MNQNERNAFNQVKSFAKAHERVYEKPVYIVRCYDKTWEFTERMPLLGEWYTTDGIKHG